MQRLSAVDQDAHVLPSALSAEHVTVSGAMTAKNEALHTALEKHGITGAPGAPRTLLFCNSVPSARALGHILDDAGVPSVGLHGDIPPRRRATEFKRFLDGDCTVLVCTDAAARGLDFAKTPVRVQR